MAAISSTAGLCMMSNECSLRTQFVLLVFLVFNDVASGEQERENYFCTEFLSPTSYNRETAIFVFSSHKQTSLSAGFSICFETLLFAVNKIFTPPHSCSPACGTTSVPYNQAETGAAPPRPQRSPAMARLRRGETKASMPSHKMAPAASRPSSARRSLPSVKMAAQLALNTCAIPRLPSR